jgi:hypothetical protein
MSQSRTWSLKSLRVSWLALAWLPLACAVATEPDVQNDGDTPQAGTLSVAGTTSVGSTSSIGGSGSTAGTSSQAGTTSNAGTTSTAGKPSGGSGSGGSASGGSASGGSASGGKPSGGSSAGGSSSTGCGSLKTWKGGDPTLQIAAGEVIQWMGKRYKANEAIAYPNTECAPDKPTDWCAKWFTADGDC